jgi:hypothetical protein
LRTSWPVRLGDILPQVLANIQKRIRENGYPSRKKTSENRAAAAFAFEAVQKVSNLIV